MPVELPIHSAFRQSKPFHFLQMSPTPKKVLQHILFNTKNTRNPVIVYSFIYLLTRWYNAPISRHDLHIRCFVRATVYMKCFLQSLLYLSSLDSYIDASSNNHRPTHRYTLLSKNTGSLGKLYSFFHDCCLWTSARSNCIVSTFHQDVLDSQSRSNRFAFSDNHCSISKIPLSKEYIQLFSIRPYSLHHKAFPFEYRPIQTTAYLLLLEM